MTVSRNLKIVLIPIASCTKRIIYTIKVLIELEVIPRVSFKVRLGLSLLNRCEFRNSEACFWSATLDSTIRAHFRRQIHKYLSRRYLQTFGRTLGFLKKMLLKKFSNAISRPVSLKNKSEIDFLVFFWPIILVSGAK